MFYGEEATVPKGWVTCLGSSGSPDCFPIPRMQSSLLEGGLRQRSEGAGGPRLWEAGRDRDLPWRTGQPSDRLWHSQELLSPALCPVLGSEKRRGKNKPPH